MATWVTHLMVADEVIKKIPSLCKHEFFVGNIAPDCNVENEDWISFIPSREVKSCFWREGVGEEHSTDNDLENISKKYQKIFIIIVKKSANNDKIKLWY